MDPAGKHILLINPWIFDFAAYNFWIKPLGLLYIAAILRKNGCRLSFLDCLLGDISSTNGFQLNLLNQLEFLPDDLSFQKKIKPIKRQEDGSSPFYKENIAKPPQLKRVPRKFSRYGLPPSLMLNALKSINKPDLILVSSGMTYWYPGCFEIIKLSRTIFPDVPIILGGIYARICPEHASTFSGADAVFQGVTEAEAILSEYSPIPGTALWPEAVKASRFDLNSDPLYHNKSIFPCQWSGFTWDDLNQLKLLSRAPA